MGRKNKCVSKSFRSAQGKTTKHGRIKKKIKKRLSWIFLRVTFNRSKKQNNITNTQANTVDVSSLVEFVSLIASLVLLLAEAYQRAPFISARIKPLLWLLGTHWGGLEMGRGCELQNIGKAEEVKIEGSKWGGNGAFVHLKENGKGKRLILGWGHSFCKMPGISVCVFVCAYSFVYDRERERREKEGNLSVREELFYICADKINMYLL